MNGPKPTLFNRLSGVLRFVFWGLLILVLVMAFLGVAMWVGLRSIWDTAEENTSDQVEEIGK